MGPDPEPGNCSSRLNPDCSIVVTNTGHPIVIDFFEVKRRMPVVRDPKPVILVCELLDFAWE